jgi:hypothetical protein
MCLSPPRRLPQSLVHFSVSIDGQLATPCGTAPLMGFLHLAVIPRVLRVSRPWPMCSASLPQPTLPPPTTVLRVAATLPGVHGHTPRCQETQPSAAPAADGCCLWPLQRFCVGRLDQAHYGARTSFHGVAIPFRVLGLAVSHYRFIDPTASFGRPCGFPAKLSCREVQFSAARSRRLSLSFEVCPVRH